MPDENAEIDPVLGPSGGGRIDPEIDRLSPNLDEFHDLFGSIDWGDDDRAFEMITETIHARVAKDEPSQHGRRNSDRENTRIEHDKARRVFLADRLLRF